VTVLDASAVLALIFEEPGQQRILEAIVDGAEMTTASFAEVATRYVLRGASAAGTAQRAGGSVTADR
jgi:PIN domain nuclease of toxin-antitoxin system